MRAVKAPLVEFIAVVIEARRYLLIYLITKLPLIIFFITLFYHFFK